MHRISETLIVIVITLFSLGRLALADDYIKINEIIENSIKYDNKELKIKGEAIGEKMNRGEYGWVNINDGSNAIGIWLTKEQLKEIEVLGDYKHKGDIIEVTGEFHRSCKEHGGDVDVHATSIVKLTRGKIDVPVVDRYRIITAIGIITSTLIFTIIFLKTRKEIY